MNLLRLITVILGSAVTGNALSTLATWYFYPTNYQITGILVVLCIGIFFLTLALVLSEITKSAILFLFAYVGVLAGLFLSVSVVIHSISDLSQQGIFKSSILLFGTLSVLYFSGRLSKKLKRNEK